ncbi:MAG: hypothetical protein NC321_00240 [Clostridium sp.]|nr:hypothetical protein [Clostridium sp.]
MSQQNIPKTRKPFKIILIIVTVLLFFILGIGAYTAYIVTRAHNEALNAQIERHPEEYDSYDGQYTIRTSVEEDASVSVHYVNIAVVDNTLAKEVFSIQKVYRAWDFGWVMWEDESYNFRVKSGDLGTFRYEYQEDGSWEKMVLAGTDAAAGIEQEDIEK